MQGLFAGRLIKAEVMTLFRNYGFEYEAFLKSSVEELTRQAISNYSLNEIIASR